MESSLVTRIEKLDDYQVVRFFSYFSQNLFDGLEATAEQLKNGIPTSIKSTAAMTQVENLSDDVLQADLNSTETVAFARATLVSWAQDDELSNPLENALNSFKDDELADGGLLLNVAYAASIILFTATTGFKIKFGGVEIIKKTANVQLVEAIMKPFSGVIAKLSKKNSNSDELSNKGQVQIRASSASRSKESDQMDKIKILFLTANPQDTEPLKLDEEIRAIDIELRKSEFRDVFDIRQQWAVRVSELSEYLLRHQPHIVHFSGHGSKTSEIILMDEQGESHPVSKRALSQLFSVLKDNIRCVVLNACHGEKQARAIAEHIDCVIGMSKAISDAAAIKFSTAFYRALGFGRSVKTAFELGCAQIDLESLGQQNTPKLITVNSKPEEIVFVQSE